MTKSTMTAAEGADRVAARFRVNHEKFNSSENETIFTCESCGGHDFLVGHSYARVTTAQPTLGCSCEDGAAGDRAAMRTMIHTEIVREWGPLDHDHHWEVEDTENDNEGWEEQDCETECASCFAAAESDDWEEDQDPEVEDVDDEWSVCCADCEHEIEFGWSHPDRGGRIWPCESNDHNPWKSWPEPRFVEAWAKRGWLHPEARGARGG